MCLFCDECPYVVMLFVANALQLNFLSRIFFIHFNVVRSCYAEVAHH